MLLASKIQFSLIIISWICFGYALTGRFDLDDIKFISNRRANFHYGPARRIPKICPREFSERCTCGIQPVNEYYNIDGGAMYVVNCSNARFTHVEMLQFVPFEAEVLIFTGNNVTFLPPSIFGIEGRINLRVIDMMGNGITEIDEKAFHHVEGVEILQLAHNELTNASLHKHPKMFSSFESLRELHLTNSFNDDVWSFNDLERIFLDSKLNKVDTLSLGMNELTVIPDPNGFCSLPSLRRLYIPQNQLTQDTNVNTSCLPNLEIIDLRNNKIQTIQPSSNLWKLLKTTNKNNEIIRLELSGNPFKCDCELQPFINWLKSEIREDPDLVRDNENLVCKYGLPTNNTGLELREVKVTQCHHLTSSEVASNVVSAIIWTLAIILLILTIIGVYMYRISILKRVSPLIHAAVTGVHYTSIDKSETVEIAHV